MSILLPPVQSPKASPPQREVAAPGTFRVIPQKPIVTPTRAVYEWRVVCDRRFGAFSGRNSALTISNPEGYVPPSNESPTAFTQYVEIDTTPRGDGSMDLQIINGHWSGKTDPLFPPSGGLPTERGSYSASGATGYATRSAESFVRRLAVRTKDYPMNANVELAHIELPTPQFGYVTAREGYREVYRRAVPVGAGERFPVGFMSNPTLDALKRQGCVVSGVYSRPGEPEQAVRLLVTDVPSKRFQFPNPGTATPPNTDSAPER